MHPDQFNAFRDQIPLTDNRKRHTAQPFVYAGHTYATDGVCLIRHPAAVDGFKVFDLEKEEEATQKFLTGLPKFFTFFDTPKGDLLPLASLHLEPVVDCRPVRFGEPDYENPHFDLPHVGFVLHRTTAALGARTFDACRLLYIRQTLPGVQFYDEPEVTEESPFHFVFGAGGQGLLMPVRVRPGSTIKHWNGAVYYPGFC